MRLIFEIEYHTLWGEQLAVVLGQRRVALEYTRNDLWQGTAEIRNLEQLRSYRYVVERDGCIIRTEWHAHSLRLPPEFPPRTALRIRDRWQELRPDAAFYSTAFTHGIFGRAACTDTRDETSAPAGIGARPTQASVWLRVVEPAIHSDETLALASQALDNWQRIVPLDDIDFPVWGCTCSLPAGCEYKLLIADRATLRPLQWEEGDNRRWEEPVAEGEIRLDASLVARFPERRWRSAGTAIPVFSLRSAESFGVGEFLDLKLLVDWAAATHQRVIQVLPVNDTSMTGTWEDSYPYNANSSFALHPQFLRLTEAGVVEDDAYRRLRDELNALPEVDYERVNRTKQRLLREAFARNAAYTASRPDYQAFLAENRSWLLPYAAYCTLRDEHHTADFTQWGDLSRYNQKRVEAYCLQRRDEVAYHCYVQFYLHLQLSEVRRYAHSRGVVLKGDLPIGVSRTSADAWQSPHLFHLDSQAGAPPDAFSTEGQNWGFPTYDWERMARDHYAWWQARLRKMAEYFDAYRIDHILGFFRIWEIPSEAIHGLLGHFNPALPYPAEELQRMGFDLTKGLYTTPPLDDATLGEIFGPLVDTFRRRCLQQGRLREEFATQRRAAEQLPGDDPETVRLREGLMTLLDDVLFVEDPRRKGYFHPRIDGRRTRSWQRLPEWQQESFNRLHDDFFYRRHNLFWKESAMRKLPVLLTATDMLACGEDLGMIPDCVPETMRTLQILSLEVQRMPKTMGETFADPSRYPYLSVCTTSTHDMNPLRAWWEEDRQLSTRFFREVLHADGDVPQSCEPWICQRIISMHLASPSMFAILPLQDWLAMDETLRAPDPHRERINIPAIPRYQWRYRMHLSLERLLAAVDFNTTLYDMITLNGRR